MKVFRTGFRGDRRKTVALGLCLAAVALSSVAAEPRPTGTVVVAGHKSKDAATAQAVRAQADRLSILATEFNEASKELAAEQAAKKPDPSNVARLQRNLAALASEIETAKRNPVPVASFKTPAARPAQSAPASVAQATDSESQLIQDAPAAPPVRFEGWDIFQNFGRKGSNYDSRSNPSR